MSQYASLLSIAANNNRNIVFIWKIDLISIFPNLADPIFNGSVILLRHSKDTKHLCHKFTKVNETAKGIFTRELLTDLPQQDVWLYGWLTSYKYFINYLPELRHRFAFNSTINFKAQNVFDTLMKDVKRTEITLVGVHVRRGDMASEKQQEMGIRLPSLSYFTKAINYYQKRYGAIHFIVTSNTIGWCKTHLKFENVSFSEGLSAVVDMALLGKCDHLITTVGTFSRWAGYLSHGDVVYYRDYIRSNTLTDRLVNVEDMFPTSWIPFGD